MLFRSRNEPGSSPSTRQGPDATGTGAAASRGASGSKCRQELFRYRGIRINLRNAREGTNFCQERLQAQRLPGIEMHLADGTPDNGRVAAHMPAPRQCVSKLTPK